MLNHFQSREFSVLVVHINHERDGCGIISHHLQLYTDVWFLSVVKGNSSHLAAVRQVNHNIWSVPPSRVVWRETKLSPFRASTGSKVHCWTLAELLVNDYNPDICGYIWQMRALLGNPGGLVICFYFSFLFFLQLKEVHLFCVKSHHISFNLVLTF